jgi:LysM repeat protein
MLLRITILLTTAFLFLILLVLPLQAAHGQDCVTTYVVQHGDNLSFIAQDFGVPVTDLITANHLRNPNLIRVGQNLCIPHASAPDLKPELMTVDLVVEYVWAKDVWETDSPFQISRDRVAGRRLAFPVSTDIVTKTILSEVRSASIDKNPYFWVVRSNASEPFSYTLVAIGDPDLIPSLVLSETVTINQVFPGGLNDPTATGPTCPMVTSLPVLEALGQNGFGQPEKLDDVRLRLEVVDPDGGFFSVAIDRVDYQPTVGLAARCHPFPTFALNRSVAPGAEGDQLMLYIQSDGSAGIPGQVRSASCKRWSSGKWWQRVMRQFYC